MADDGQRDFRAGLGSVEQEAHKLVRAAAEWLASDGGPGPGDATPDGPTQAADEGPQAGGPGTGDSQPHEQATCTGCPWCRAKAAAGPVGADTLDSLADLLGSASVSLRHFAQSRRATHPESGSRPESAGTGVDPDTEEDTDGFDYPDPT